MSELKGPDFVEREYFSLSLSAVLPGAVGTKLSTNLGLLGNGLVAFPSSHALITKYRKYFNTNHNRHLRSIGKESERQNFNVTFTL